MPRTNENRLVGSPITYSGGERRIGPAIPQVEELPLEPPVDVVWVDGVPFAPKDEVLAVARDISAERSELMHRLAQ